MKKIVAYFKVHKISASR